MTVLLDAEGRAQVGYRAQVIATAQENRGRHRKSTLLRHLEEPLLASQVYQTLMGRQILEGKIGREAVAIFRHRQQRRILSADQDWLMRHSLSEAQQIIDKGLVMIRPNPEPAYILRACG